MDEIKKNYNLLKSSLCIISFLGILFIHKKISIPSLELSPQETTIHINEDLIRSLSLGQTRLLSSLLWAETLLKGDIKHYEKNDLSSWMFLRLKLITELDPYFYKAYLYGSVYLSIIKDDIEGASYLYKRGLELYPNDLQLNLHAGFHFYFEAGDINSAVAALDKASNNPNFPPRMKSILSRLKAEAGLLEDSYNIILSFYKNAPENSAIQKKFEENLFSLKTEIDLKCLNSKKEGCAHQNLKGNRYLYKDNVWVSPEPWEPFRPKNKKSPRHKARAK